MDDRKKTLAAIAIIIGVVVLIVVAIGAILSGGSIISPVPPDGAIKIIFLSPTPGPTHPSSQ